VVGVDGSEPSKQALRWAVQMAALLGSSVEAVAAWDYPYAWGLGAMPVAIDAAGDMEKVLRQSLDEAVGDRPQVSIELAVRQGSAAKALLDASAGAVMLVVGSRGHGGFAGLLLGSVSANVAEHAACPVLVIHGDVDPMVPVPAV
jgi:nucleotide-binding universal stress UspA family protein